MKTLSQSVVINSVWIIGSMLFPITIFAETKDVKDDCLLDAIKSAEKSATAQQIRDRCERDLTREVAEQGVISRRISSERETAFEPYVITPHKMNYILPISITDSINKNAYEFIGDWAENLETSESKFQVSIKVPLNYDSIFTEGDGIYAGYTLQSWWQVYSDNISKPFRETNYQPELFYIAPLDWHPVGGNTGFVLGVEHQSNGRA